MAGLGDYFRVSGAETGCAAPFATYSQPFVPLSARAPCLTCVSSFWAGSVHAAHGSDRARLQDGTGRPGWPGGRANGRICNRMRVVHGSDGRVLLSSSRKPGDDSVSHSLEYFVWRA